MARIDTLTNFLTDVADSIRSKTGKSDAIACEDFDTEIESISGGDSQKNRLPDAYQEVEYIQSSGTQYFDTGYYANGNSQYEFKFSHGSTSGVVFGAYNSAWTTGSGYYHSNSSAYYEWVHYYSNNSINKNGSATNEYEYKIDKGYVYFKGTLIYSLNTKSFTLNYPTYILAGNWAGSKAQEPISARLYYFRIRENDIAIHNYIPCYRKSDGVIGLYDLVENKFITNAGTGTFEKGPDHDTPLINLQDKSVTITENTTTNITPDQGYDGLNSVEVITDVSGSGADLTEYFNTTVTNQNESYFAKNYLVKKTPNINVDVNCTSLYHAFDGLGVEELKVICNHTNLTSLGYAFCSMTKLLNLDLLNFKCNNVTNMSYAFSNCEKIKEIDLSKINANSVTDMSYMFVNDYKLETINFANFDTSNVTNMRNLFQGCYELSNIDLKNFNTKNVTNMQAMFTSPSAAAMNFTSLDLSSFDTSKVKNMSNMFNGCKLLEELDISNFDFSGVTSYANIFRSCGTSTTTGLTKVYVKDETAQQWILNLNTSNRPSTWTTDNVIIAGSEADLRS